MSNHRKGFLRDRAILEAIERHEILNTEQICLLFFKSLNNGLRIAQRRLKALYERKLVNRARESFSEPYYYFVGKRPAQVAHKLGINWVYVWLTVRLKSWEEMFCFIAEQDYGILRADALAGIKNTVTGEVRFYFVEFDNAESGNHFDKVTKYNALYESEQYTAAWWVDYASRFPAVLVVTTNPRRLKTIQGHIERENTNGLEFKVCLLDEIKGGCFNAAVRNFLCFPAGS